MSVIAKTLSVCIISKNEEKNIGKCLDSVKNIAEEIIVVDTGSTDNTVKIAKEKGAKVINHIWDNDFSAARNKSIDNATKDWILFLDCDEEILEEDGQNLINLINQETPFEGFYLRLVNIITGSIVSDAIVLRVFKNKPEYRFKFKMHEQIITSIQDAKGTDSIGETPIKIMHYGYDPAVSDTDKKSKRNLEILLSYDEKDKDGYYYYVLGNEYARVNDYKTALKYYYDSLNRTNAKQFRYIYYPYLVANIVKTYFVQKRFLDALKLIESTRDTLPAYKDLYFIECLCYVEMSKLTKANESLSNYLACPVGNYEYPSNKYDNFHDIPKLRSDLNEGSVPNPEKMLTVWIPMEEWNDNIINCIKSVNEIAYEVFILTTNPKAIKSEEIRQFGARIVNVSPSNSVKLFNNAMKLTRGENVLIINPGEICSYVSQIQFVNLLADEEIGKGFGLRILDMQKNQYTLRFTLFKTNKKMKSIEEYMKYLKERNEFVEDIEILIHSNVKNEGDKK